MPDVPPAVATVGAIVAANVAVTLLWKYVPPAWKLLNRYFVIVPFYPSSLGMIGSTFSHQTWRHLGTNMMVLGLMGTRGMYYSQWKHQKIWVLTFFLFYSSR